MLATIRKQSLVLTFFAALATGVTASVYYLTKSHIDAQHDQQQKQLLGQVLPNDLYDNDLLKECYIVTDKFNKAQHVYVARKQGDITAVAIESTAPDGYSGAIHLIVGANLKGHIYGVRVVSHAETVGLGDKIDIRVSDWITHFSGQTVTDENDTHWAVKKDGGQFDQFTGATITPRAVVNAVKHTALSLKDLDIASLPHCEEAS